MWDCRAYGEKRILRDRQRFIRLLFANDNGELDSIAEEKLTLMNQLLSEEIKFQSSKKIFCNPIGLKGKTNCKITQSV